MVAMVLIELVPGNILIAILFVSLDDYFGENFSDGSLESPHEQQSEHVSRSRTRDMDDFIHAESSSGHRRVSVAIY